MDRLFSTPPRSHAQQQTPQQMQQAHNPFSDPRLLEDTPPRHTSPYALARGTGGPVALAQAERLAAAAAAGGEEELQRLSLSGFGGQHQQQQLQQPAFSFGSFGLESSPVRTHSSPQTHPPPLSPSSPARAAAAPSSRSDNSAELYHLLKAAREGDCRTVRQLLQSSAHGPPLDVNAADRDGDTALHRACAGGHLNMVHMLVLEFNANMHQTNVAGSTPLLVAVQVASAQPPLELVRLLVTCGSDMHAANAAGVSALSIAQQQRSAASSHTSPFGSGSSGNASSQLHQVLLEAQASPVRQFALARSQEVTRLRAQLDAATAKLQAEEQARVAQDKQLAAAEGQRRTLHAALTNGVQRLGAMDSELERVARAQQQQANSAQPQVLISEIRHALQSVRTAFIPAPV